MDEKRRYHLLCTYDGSRLKLYQDGKIMENLEYNCAYDYPREQTIFIMGADPRGQGPETYYFEGKIYSAKIYSRALEETEIATNYNYENTRYNIDEKNNTSPIIYYDAKNNVGTGIYDKTATQWKNLSGDSYNGILGNFNNTEGSGWQDGEYLKFDGSNDYVKIGEINKPTFALETVIQYDTVPSRESDIIANWESGGIGLYGESGRFYGSAYINGSYKTCQSTQAIDTSKKYHLVLTFNGKNMIFYVNGEKVGTYFANSKYSYPMSSTYMFLGTDPRGQNPDGCYFYGKIYAVKIYDRDITQEEVAESYVYEKNRYNIEE